MTYLRLIIVALTNDGRVWVTIEESSDGEEWIECGLIKMNKHHFFGFKDALDRGKGNRTEIVFVDQDLEERLDWEVANKSQS